MSKHVLVVEDSEELISLYRDLLEPDGYRLSFLAGSDDIIQHITELQPDIVLLDFLIAGINGGELCSQIKKNPATSRIPVIMATAYPRLLNSLGHYGWDDFIAKPFELEEFYRVIRKHSLKVAS
ncbi:response regulator [Mucilaginibacter ginsenosidivorans]|uniref:Response regulator n=1 Tax=Mucilaginibacter ginsenosidivorans TaxID=398053 RepID=A0A5B8UYX5_9SPHI|nr:response regulator [Mucilaginibacter ginsenosidivorans]QEC64294.1 response regulator [Mucilaginibacter ginsenosidivorans]